MAVGCSGSRTPASKSITASNAPPVRIQALTSWRTASRAGFQAPGRKVSFSNGVSVPPKIFTPRSLRPQRKLLQAGDHGRSVGFFLRPALPIAQIVGAQQHDDMRHARLRQHVAIEPAQAAVAANVVQDAVAAEPLVHHAHRPSAAPRRQPAGKLARPVGPGVVRRDVAVGQRIAERHDPARARLRQHVDAADEIPIVGDAPDRHFLRIGEVARAEKCSSSPAHSGR